MMGANWPAREMTAARGRFLTKVGFDVRLHQPMALNPKRRSNGLWRVMPSASQARERAECAAVWRTRAGGKGRVLVALVQQAQRMPDVVRGGLPSHLGDEHAARAREHKHGLSGGVGPRPQARGAPGGAKAEPLPLAAQHDTQAGGGPVVLRGHVHVKGLEVLGNAGPASARCG